MTSMMRIAIGVATAALLAACGGGGDGGNADTGDGPAGATTLTMVENEFQPADLTASAGADIEVVNDGQALHNLTVEGADIDEDVDPGGSTTVTIDLEPGEYRFVCEYHEAQGMEGTLTVQ